MSVNNNFANRIFLGGLPVSTTGSNIGDTGEVGEPPQSGVINSAWWSWTAPSTGTVSFDTIGSNFDTWLSVYTGSPVNNLSLIGFNDDGGPNWTSKLTRNVTAGTTYQIAVDGYQSNTGSINLNIALAPPPNDNFANRITLTGAAATTTGSNIRATAEPQEPAQSGPINSSWWDWTAPNSGPYNIDTRGSGFDTYLSVFTGSTVGSLNLIGANDDVIPGSDLTSRVSLNAIGGTTYRLAVDGYQSNTGAIQLNIAPPSPPNDNFASQIALSGVTATTTGSNIGATGEPQEPAQSGPINSAWWGWTAPTTERYNIDTRGSNFDTYLSVFTGSPVGNLTLIGANDDVDGTLASRVSLDAIAGTTYRLAVDGYQSNTGVIGLNIALTPPPNDNFANRITLTGGTTTTTGSNRGATAELYEFPQSEAINSAWWTWTAPSTGTFTIDTRGSGFDTYLSLFTGNNVSTLARVAQDDDSGGLFTSLITRSFTAGETYQIAVDGYSSATGPIRLSVTPGTTGSAYAAAEITETANKGDGVKDPLTGTVADTLSLPFAESSVFPSVPVTDLTMGQEKDLLLDGGAAFDAPSLFSPVSTLVKDQSLVLMEPNGALAGNPALKINNDAFGLAQTSPLAEDPYLFGLSQAKPLGI